MTSTIKKGSMVLVPKGTKIITTGPKRCYTAGKSYKVLVHRVNPGYNTYVNYHGEETPEQAPSIIWVGAGQYWCEAPLSEVKLVTE